MADADHAAAHLTTEQIEARLDWLKASPADSGALEGICIRPKVNEREELERCLLSPEGGVEGDFWAEVNRKMLAEGSSYSAGQVALMNSRAIEAVAGSRDRWKLAGDQLFVDFDLSESNLAPGDRLHVGPAILEIVPIPHTGCDLFKERFGMDAVKFINSAVGKSMRLRGIFAQVVQEGVVSIGDSVRKADAR
ncbi:MAG: MOSC domain-containing protein [Candidatus Poribacteria bacterium]